MDIMICNRSFKSNVPAK